MSEAYAALCDVTATLLTIDPKNVDLSGIWGQTEFPRLQQTGNPGGQVDTVSFQTVACLFSSCPSRPPIALAWIGIHYVEHFNKRTYSTDV